MQDPKTTKPEDDKEKEVVMTDETAPEPETAEETAPEAEEAETVTTEDTVEAPEEAEEEEVDEEEEAEDEEADEDDNEEEEDEDSEDDEEDEDDSDDDDDEDDDEDEEEEEEEKDNKKKIIIIILLLIILIAAGIGAFLFFNNNQDQYDTGASSISNATGNYEDIVNELNAKTEASRVWISVANTIHVKSDGVTCYAQSNEGSDITVLDNIEDNTRDLKYTLTLEDGTVIYESGLIKPGEGIAAPILAQKLDAGTYTVTATAQGYEDQKASGGTVAAQVTMIVEE